MQFPEIKRQPAIPKPIATVSAFLEFVSQWTAAQGISNVQTYQSRAWYRGQSQDNWPLLPGVYRQKFLDRSKAHYGKNDEEKLLNVERDMLAEFRSVGAEFVNSDSILEVYFLAQHYGMPTRLLDWTSNPLAGLFFAVSQPDSVNGEVYLMDPTALILTADESVGLYKIVYSMRHPYTSDAIRPSFWMEQKLKRKAVILPVRPDNLPGRIGQQSSCFTFHMREAAEVNNPTMARLTIPAGSKSDLRKELHRLNVNQFTVFNDLDHLSAEMKRSYGV
jgi:hypothetical protein